MGAPESGLTGINPPGKGAGRLEQAPRPRADTASPWCAAEQTPPPVDPTTDNIRHLTAHMATGGATAKCAKPLEKSGVTIIVTG